MGKITEIRASKNSGKRVNIYVDDQFALTIDLETAIKEKLRIAMEIDESRIEELKIKDQINRCYNAAIRLLGYRQRSEYELRDKLVHRGFNRGIVNPVIDKLIKQGLVDDETFAKYWAENRETFSPRSRYLTALELRKKGVAEEVIKETVVKIDDEESAYRTALNRVERLHVSNRKDLQRRLGDFLRRRGFDYETINRTINKIWQAKGIHSS